MQNQLNAITDFSPGVWKRTFLKIAFYAKTVISTLIDYSKTDLSILTVLDQSITTYNSHDH